MFRTSTLGRSLLFAVVCGSPAAALAQNAADTAENDTAVTVSVGTNYTTGDYGDPQKTNILSVPVSVRLRTGNFSLRASIPWIRLDGPGQLIDSGFDDGGGSGRGRGRSGSNSGSGSGIDIDDDGNPLNNGVTSGLGDLTIAATYELELASNVWLDANARVKVPTASVADRLGTGEVDVTVGGDLVTEIGDVTLYAGGRRRFVGNSATTTYRDVWGAGAGLSVQAADGVTVGADVDWQQSAVIGNGVSSDISGWASFRLVGPLRLKLFAGTGLSTNSHAFTGGASLTYRF